jgi:mono/diheme cytochrome c family protein
MSRLRRLRERLGWPLSFLAAAFALLVLAQAVPYGRSHDNPTPTRQVAFPSKVSEQLFATACGDCHSDNTRWPWYSNVAPMSWLVQSDVDEGRGIFNVSEWDRSQPALEEISEVISEGEMPPSKYTLIHRDAKLSSDERTALIDALRQIYAASPPG